MITSPFKFLDSYTKADKDIFFGRESEIEDVYTKVFQGKILLVYGASGTGKSSLISCGLANKFDDADWLPVNVRRGININDSLQQQLGKQMLTAPSPGSSPALLKTLKSVYLDHFKPIFLIFDQFEELFIFGDREEWMSFAASVRSVLDSSIQVRFVLIIRGEYLEYLTDLEEILPELFTNRLRIEKITRAKAVNCIVGPCRAHGIEVEEHFAENLLTKLSPSKTEIELTYLQVFLDRIFKKAVENATADKVVFSNALLTGLGNVGDVLSQFLDEQIELIPDKEKALALLKAFVSTDATKKQITSEQAAGFVQTIGMEMDTQLAERLIHELVNRRIIKDKDEAGRYELRHDSIAVKIYEKITSYERDLIEVSQFINYAFGEHQKRHFLLNESDLTYIEPYESKFNLAPEVLAFIQKSKATVRKKKRSRKQFYAVLGVVSLLLATSIVALVYAFVQQVAATKSAEVATEQRRVAEEQRQLAEEERQRAETSAEAAGRWAAQVLAQMKRGDSLRTVSELERQRAEREAEINAFRFDRILPVVLGPTAIYSGGYYKGNLFIAGSTSSLQGAQMLVNGQPINLQTDPETGMDFGQIEFVATAKDFNSNGLSTQSFQAEIRIPNKDTLIRNIEYQVVSPTVRVTNGNAPTLYKNCANNILIEVPALGPVYNPNFTAKGGVIIKGEGPGRITVVPQEEKMEITIYNGGAEIGRETFNTKPVPNPQYIARDSTGRAIDLRNGIQGSQIGVQGSNLRFLTVFAEADYNFMVEVPKDSKYEIAEMVVILARGTERVDQFTAKTGKLDLKLWRRQCQPGDRIIVDIKKVARITYDGSQEPVDVSNVVLIVPIQ